MRYWPVLLLASVLVLAGSGCVKGSKVGGGQQTVGTAASTAAEGTTASEGATPETPPAPAPLGGKPAPPPAPPATPGEPTKAPEDLAQQLTGEWTALFGRQEVGVIENAWEDGHRVIFNTGDTGVWTKLVKGAKTDTVECKWRISDGDLLVTLDGTKAAKTGLWKMAPLGIGRNEEIGLLKATPGSVDTEHKMLDKRLKVVLRSDFLALTDEHTRMMVYARYKGKAKSDPSAIAALGGEWSGKYGSNTALIGTATWDGKSFTLAFDDGSKFSGAFVDGYLVGRMSALHDVSLAALQPVGTDRLVGAYTPDPYAKMLSDFSFERAG
jgi:hypothetical protein